MRGMTFTAAAVAIGLSAMPGDTPAQMGRGGGRPAPPQPPRPAPAFNRPAPVPSFRPVAPTPRPAPNFARPAPIPTVRPNAPVARPAVPPTRPGGGMLNPGGVRPPVNPPPRPTPLAGTTRPAPVPTVPGRLAPVPPTTRPGQPTTSFRPNVPPGSMPRPSQEQLGHWLNMPMQRNWPGAANQGTFVNNRWERWNNTGNFNAFVQTRGNHVRSAAVNDFRVNRFDRFFTPDWFRTAHHHGFFWNFRPATPWFWWNFATTPNLLNWLAWSGVTPIYYNYGDNVVYRDDTIYLDQQPVANVDAYVDQATQLALAGAQALAPAAASTEEAPAPQPEWLPLGVFALTHEEQGEPTIFLQLAVTKDGLIGGTYTNASTGETQNVTGKIDKQSQRAAWIIGDNQDAVMEAGAFNLTQDQAPVLVHWGKEKTQTWLLTRVPAPTQ